MESQFHRRVLSSCVGAACVAAGAAGLLGAAFSHEVWPLGLLLGGAALAPAQVLRSAASLQRAAAPRPPTARGLATALGAVAASALATELLSAGLGAEDAGSSGCFGPLVGAAALARLGGLSNGLALVLFQWAIPPSTAAHFEWSALPRERAHRRVKARLCGLVLQAALLSLACAAAAALLDGAALDWRPRVLAAASLLLAGDALAEGLQDCTCVLGQGPPTAAELLAALGQPLATRGPGLGRWLALTGLAQAVAHRQPGAFPGVHAGAGVGCCGPPAARLPAFAAELLALPGGGRPSGAAGGAAVLGRAGAAAAAPWGDGGGPQAQPGGPGGPGRGLFAAYLASGLEVIREFTIRVQGLTQAAQPLGPGALSPGQVAELAGRLAELLPLFRVSVAGLTGWVCLSRDVDKCGVVQREEALGRLLAELCGALGALEALAATCGAPGLSTSAASAARRAREEVRLGVQQLVVAFEDAGLREVSLPAEYKALIAGLCQ